MTKLSIKGFIDFRLSELKEKGIDNARIVALVSTFVFAESSLRGLCAEQETLRDMINATIHFTI